MYKQKLISKFYIAIFLILGSYQAFAFELSCGDFLEGSGLERSNVVVLVPKRKQISNTRTEKAPLFYLPQIDQNSPNIDVVDSGVIRNMLMAQEHPLDSLLADTRLYHRTGKLDDFTEARNVLAIRYIEHYSEMLKIVSVLEAIAADFLSYETHELKNLFIMVKQSYDVVT